MTLGSYSGDLIYHKAMSDNDIGFSDLIIVA